MAGRGIRLIHPYANRSSSPNIRREISILLSVLVGLLILSVRPFGFRTFINGLGHDNIFSLLLVVSAVGICIVLLQRVGVIFSDADVEVVR